MSRKNSKLSDYPFELRPHASLVQPCKLYIGKLDRGGYARVKRYGKMETIHRVAYAEYNGLTLEQMSGLLVCHRCDVRHCFESTHLFLGTHLDNNRDCVAKGRHYNGDQRGEHNPSSKLTEQQVLKILAGLQNGVQGTVLAEQYKVSKQLISLIKRGAYWKHVKSVKL